MQATIRARTARDATSSVVRLYERTLPQIVAELLQNARRAGATRIRVEIEPGRCRVTDDGRGIADPQVLLSYGSSAWDEDVVRERPAGLGFSALAGRGCTVGSKTTEGARWQATISPAAFAGECEVPIEPVDETGAASGTWVEFALVGPAESDRYAARIVENAARYLPVEVECNAVTCERRDYLEDAVHVVRGAGSRIGIYRDEMCRGEDRIQFHGIGASWRAPFVAADQDWTARVALDELGDRELVLPGRDRLIDNDAKRALADEVFRAIYETIEQVAPGSRLAYRDREHASALGVEMQPAKARLHRWHPEPLDEGLSWRSTDAPQIVELDPDTEYWRVDEQTLCGYQRQLLGEALAQLQGIAAVQCNARYEGYEWYDRLATVERVTSVEGRTGLQTRVDLADGRTRWCPARIGIVTGDRDGPNREEDFDVSLADVSVVVSGTHVSVHDLAQFLLFSFYRQSEDFDADSAETQFETFDNLCHARAIEALEGPRKARLGRIRDEVNYHVNFLTAPGDTVRFTGAGALVRHSRLWSAWYRTKERLRGKLAGAR